LRLRHPTALADGAPPDCDAAGGVGAPARVAAADLVALGWAAPSTALDEALDEARPLWVEGGGAVRAPARAAAAPPARTPKRPRPATPPPPAHPHAVGDLVWMPAGCAWWPAEVGAVSPGGTVSATVLALHLAAAAPSAAVAPIGDDFEGRAALATTGAGAQVRGGEGVWKIVSGKKFESEQAAQVRLPFPSPPPRLQAVARARDLVRDAMLRG